ncbi:MAG: hypothetical protein ABIS51_08960 [Sphingomonas sp.]
MKALKGNQIAQRGWIEMVQQAELEQMHDQLAICNLMERPPQRLSTARCTHDELKVVIELTELAT